ncbi:E3 ubiquitin-protein ligase RNF181-like [Ylistrum balloti]|uniref:E3 ubiquitin-protein ligase RNF181-like n=1 Tax=Ylistrum balloti TaxID=509963 RepID=UPI002905D19D|nr:E3 ubiquitin-protein ligase RNF181-like [Ylistrum balloti]
MASYFDEHDCEPLKDGEQPNHMLHMARLLLDSGLAAEWDLEYGRIFGGDGKTPPASKKIVESLPTHIVTPTEAALERKCPVCLGLFDEEDEVKEIPCSHKFHSKCILPWLDKVNSCPMCRHELPTDDPDYEAYKKHKARAKQREYEMEELHNSMFG